MKFPLTAIATAYCLVLAACSSDTPVKEPAKAIEKPEAISGRHAFQQIYPMARGWAIDAMPVVLQNINLSQVKSTPGKAGAWEVVFYSPASGKAKMYTWSAVEAEGNLHQGVFAGQEESLRSKKPFILAAIQQDSDEAYKVAAEKSEDYIKKNPDKPVQYILAMTDRYPQLVWRVMWGESGEYERLFGVCGRGVGAVPRQVPLTADCRGSNETPWDSLLRAGRRVVAACIRSR